MSLKNLNKKTRLLFMAAIVILTSGTFFTLCPIFGVASQSNFRFENYYYESNLNRALNKLFSDSTTEEDVYKILVVRADGCFSERFSADKAEFRGGYKTSALWNKDNYYIDYAQSNQNESRVRTVRILFDGNKKSMLEIHAQITGTPAFPFIGEGFRFPNYFVKTVKCYNQ